MHAKDKTFNQYEVVKTSRFLPPGTHFFPEAPLLLRLLLYLPRNTQAFIAMHRCNPCLILWVQWYLTPWYIVHLVFVLHSSLLSIQDSSGLHQILLDTKR